MFQRFLLALLLTGVPGIAAAQGHRFGLAAGIGLVGGSDGRVAMQGNGFRFTGAGQAGLHIRATYEQPLSGPGLSFRGELFLHTQHSDPNSYAATGGETVQMALRDQTLGLTGSVVSYLRPNARVSPMFLIGAGLFNTRLGTNPDPASDEVTEWHYGMGLGMETGVGLRIRGARRDLLLEWRYMQAISSPRSGGLMPLTIGVTF